MLLNPVNTKVQQTQTMKLKFSLLILVLISVFLSCSESDDNDQKNSKTNSFTINGSSYEANFATKVNYSDHYEIAIATHNTTKAQFTGSLSFFGFLIESETKEIVPGTYSFTRNTDPDYDKKVHFFNAEAAQNIEFINGTADVSESNLYANMDSGMVTIEKLNAGYRINFDVKFENATITGSYEGAVTNE